MSVAHGDTVAVRDDVKSDVVVVNACGAGVDAGETTVVADGVIVPVVLLRLAVVSEAKNRRQVFVREMRRLTNCDRKKAGGRDVPTVLHRAKPLPQHNGSKRFMHAWRAGARNLHNNIMFAVTEKKTLRYLQWIEANISREDATS